MEETARILHKMAGVLLDLDSLARSGRIDIMALTNFRCPMCGVTQNRVDQANQVLCAGCREQVATVRRIGA